jgi:hypothetical protein
MKPDTSEGAAASPKNWLRVRPPSDSLPTHREEEHMPFRSINQLAQPHKTMFAFLYVVVLALLMGLAGCQSDSPHLPVQPTEVVNTNPGDQPSENIPAVVDIPASWAASPHAQTFVAGEGGKNSDCARCHAPVEFIPTMDDLPESCFTCKFTVEPPPPVIPEDAWTHINCQVCHQVNKRGEVEAGYAWLLIAAISEYEALESTSELCLKCHAGVDVTGHTAILVEGAHLAMACTDCHDPHSTSASCADSTCHAAASMTAMAGHDPQHEAIACATCHDNKDLEIDVTDTGEWITFLTVDAGSEQVIRPFTSHDITRDVRCDRCHFPGNPWDIPEEVE